MEQDTNAMIDVNENTITFDATDFTEGGTPAEPNAPAEEVNAQTESAAEQTEMFLDVVYNGESKSLTKDEAVSLAQKGMNYDYLKNRYDELSNARLLTAARRSAEAAGVSEEEFAQRLEAQLEERDIKRIEKERNVDKDTAKSIYDAERRSSDLEGEVAALREFKRKAELKDAMRQEWAEFAKNHPGINTLDDLPKEVIDAVKAGSDLENAYMAYDYKQVKKQIEEAKTAAKSPGSAASNAYEAGEDDLFLRGFSGKGF
ncbi:MAG: hypothetical protein IJV67_02565 [Clostridia bacterium]|nr:hypothetical protein [Clostridia bacterium]